MMASCQAARLPLALIFWAKVLVWGVTTITVKLGLPVSGALGVVWACIIPPDSKTKPLIQVTH
jgi:hypothetical protein